MKRAAGAIFFLLVILFLINIVSADIIINEVMYDPSPCSDSDCEYVEIFNNGIEPVNLTGWSIQEYSGSGSVNHKLITSFNSSNLTINVGEYIVIANDPDSLSQHFNISCQVAESNFGLNNPGDNLSILNFSNSTFDSLNYTNSIGANGDNADGNGHSLQFCNGIWIGNPSTPGSENDCTIPPDITINFPNNNTNSSNINLDVNYIASDEIALFNCWYSNDSGKNNYTLTGCSNIIGKTWLQGINNVTVWANDTAGNINKSSVRFTIDTINPNINITSPTNNTNSSDTNLDINYIYSDANIQSCWYSNDSMQKNISINCGQNITTIVWSEGWHNIIIWANDSAGNENKSLVSFIIDSTFSNSSSSEEEISLSMDWEDSEIINGNEFNITLEVNNLEDYSYDIKVWMEFEDDDAVISDRYDENESKWKSGTYYINNFFEGPGDDTKEIPLRIRDNYRNFSGNAKIFFKLRKNGGSTYTDIDESIEILAGENNTGNPEGEILLANTESNNSNQLTAANQNSDGVIQLGNPNVKLGTKNATVQENVIYQSKSEKMKEYSIFGFAALCVFISVLAIFNKL